MKKMTESMQKNIRENNNAVESDTMISYDYVSFVKKSIPVRL